MPTIALVEGIRLMMYGNDHPPPHFHALFAEHRAVIDLATLAIVRGELPKNKARVIIDWAKLRRVELMTAWLRTQAHLPPGRIE